MDGERMHCPHCGVDFIPEKKGGGGCIGFGEGNQG